MIKKIVLTFCLIVSSLVFSHSIKFENKGEQKIVVFYKLGQISRGKNSPNYKLHIANDKVNSLKIHSKKILQLQIDDLGNNFKSVDDQQIIIIPIVTKIVYYSNKKDKKSKTFSINDTKSMLSNGDHNEKIIWVNNNSDAYFVHTGASYLEVFPLNDNKSFNIWLSINKGKTLRRIT